MTEREAIRRLQQGDIDGLEALVRCHQVKAIRAAFLITRDLALAQEIVQTAFLRVYERIGQFDASRPFAPWFFRIVANDAVKATRRSGRHLSLELPLPNEDGQLSLDELLTDNRPRPDEQIEAMDLREIVWEALEKLTPKQRAAVVLRYYLDMSETEMAGELKVAPGTVKWHLHVARERLRTLLKEA